MWLGWGGRLSEKKYRSDKMEKPITITKKNHMLQIKITDVRDLFLLYISPKEFFDDKNGKIGVTIAGENINSSDLFKKIFNENMNEEEHFKQYYFDEAAREITYWDSFIFRGQEDEAWDLETSLYREYNRLSKRQNDKSLFDREKMLLREFLRQYARFGNNQRFDDMGYFEWLTLMQHYGAPTRFLDFSYSFYVALYFASKNINFNKSKTTNFSIFAVNYRWIEQRFKEIAPERITKLFITKDNLGKDKEIQKEIIESSEDGKRFKGVRNANTFNYNSRLVHQRGTFLIPMDIDESFLTNLNAMLIDGNKIYDNKVIKINVSLDEKHLVYLYKQLRHMNISAENLFEDDLSSLGEVLKRKLLESKYSDVLVLNKQRTF
jgi:hypothetical protein